MTPSNSCVGDDARGSYRTAGGVPKRRAAHDERLKAWRGGRAGDASPAAATLILARESAGFRSFSR